MVISKTPLRISFVGGGSDLPAFYQKDIGAVVSVTINKHIYVTVNKKFDNHIRLSYSKTENVNKVKKIKHRLVKAALEYSNIDGGIEITSMADIPSQGTGLGSSSSFAVGLMHAIHAYRNDFSTPNKLAEEACYLEIDILKDPIGKQDQYAASFGGLNLIQFNPNDSVFVSPIITLKQTRQTLEKNLLMLYTGIQRSTSSILKTQNENTKKNRQTRNLLKKMVKLTFDLKSELEKNNLNALGQILHENWLLKKKLAEGISTPLIDKWYDIGIKNGAMGGKILGAGAGGFLMFYAPYEKHEGIIQALPHLRPVNIEFDYQGSRIVFLH